MPKYTRDPEAEGYGSYLVFWLGAEYTTVLIPEEGTSNEPEKLKSLLERQLDPAL